jgi:hypothetical protein
LLHVQAAPAVSSVPGCRLPPVWAWGRASSTNGAIGLPRATLGGGSLRWTYGRKSRHNRFRASRSKGQPPLLGSRGRSSRTSRSDAHEVPRKNQCSCLQTALRNSLVSVWTRATPG